jgi:WW domain-binding protein 4
VRPTSAPVASTSSGPRKPVPKPSNPYANYSTAASLGYTDPDAERAAAEVERRRTEGVVGDWEVVASSSTAAPVSSTDDASEETSEPGEAVDTGTGLKREAEAPVDEEDGRQFKLRKKTVALGLGDVYDPGLIPIKLKKKEEAEPVLTTAAASAPTASVSTPDTATSSGAPKWTKIQWKRAETSETPAEQGLPQESHQDDSTKESVLKTEEQPADLAPTPQKWSKVQFQISGDGRLDVLSSKPTTGVSEMKIEADSAALPIDGDAQLPIPKQEETAPIPATAESTGGMFRKRKIPAGGSRGRR